MLELINIQMENRCNKIPLSFGGFFYIEKFDGEREEDDRAKLYDEFGGYLDYFVMDGATEEKYNNFIDYLKNAKDFDDFLNKLDLQDIYYIYTGDTINEVLLKLKKYFEEEDNDDYELLCERIKDRNWTDRDLIRRYDIQKIGENYFVMVL